MRTENNFMRTENKGFGRCSEVMSEAKYMQISGRGNRSLSKCNSNFYDMLKRIRDFKFNPGKEREYVLPVMRNFSYTPMISAYKIASTIYHSPLFKVKYFKDSSVDDIVFNEVSQVNSMINILSFESYMDICIELKRLKIEADKAQDVFMAVDKNDKYCDCIVTYFMVDGDKTTCFKCGNSPKGIRVSKI